MGDFASRLHPQAKPVSVERGRPTHQPMTPKEQAALRGLLGSLQWPAVQSARHLQASTSLLSGEMAGGLSNALLEANRLLKFAKENSDVGLRYPPLGPLHELRLSCMVDAAHAVRADGSSQGGYIMLLTHKSAFEGSEVPYHVIDWKSYKLPRVARSSLSAEAQSMGQADDSMDFVVRFWHVIHVPEDSLRQTLELKEFSLQPTMITDAKALYDSFHREALNTSATDKRTNLEIKVTKEQIQNMGGILKWISSESQYGDGFTKLSARQLLADRVRHGKIKYTWDPMYQASKKKTKEERERSRQQFTTTATRHHTTKTHKHKTEMQEDSEMAMVPEWEEAIVLSPRRCSRTLKPQA